MYTDALLQLSSEQAVTTSAVSTNTVDLGVAKNVGAGEQIYVRVNVTEAADAVGAGTVNFQVIQSAAANLGSATVIGQTGAIGKAKLTAGASFDIPIPRSFVNMPGQRYLGLNYEVGTGPLTAGKFSATIVLQGADSVSNSYASGFSVK